MSSEEDKNTQCLFGEVNNNFFELCSLDFEPMKANTKGEDLEGLSKLSSLFYPSSPTEPEPYKAPNQCKPDSDSIKMFVGQIPHTYDENTLLPMFEKFGKVYELRVLRDKITKRSKGCCFVTFLTRKAALEAQNALHNIKVFPGMHHAVQMKPADSENRTDRKLFIGMIPKTFSESDVRNLFSPFGTIEECTILRDLNKQSKGCAFVTYLTRQNAHNAIKSMHHSHVFEGCSSPMVVKFADTQKDKYIRRLHFIADDVTEQLNRSKMFPLISNDSMQPFASSNIFLLPSYTRRCANVIPQVSVVQPLNLSSVQAAWNVTLPANNVNTTASQTSTENMTFRDVMAVNRFLMQFNGNRSDGLITIPQEQSESIFNSISCGLDKIIIKSDAWDSSLISQKQIEGPDGANLFIYHLPIEFTDNNLADLFEPYGKVVSAKVFIDKVTRLSKCFGFVSYDNAFSAKIAIRNLHEYSINGKKLKVEFKKKNRQ